MWRRKGNWASHRRSFARFDLSYFPSALRAALTGESEHPSEYLEDITFRATACDSQSRCRCVCLSARVCCRSLPRAEREGGLSATTAAFNHGPSENLVGESKCGPSSFGPLLRSSACTDGLAAGARCQLNGAAPEARKGLGGFSAGTSVLGVPAAGTLECRGVIARLVASRRLGGVCQWWHALSFAPQMFHEAAPALATDGCCGCRVCSPFHAWRCLTPRVSPDAAAGLSQCRPPP